MKKETTTFDAMLENLRETHEALESGAFDRGYQKAIEDTLDGMSDDQLAAHGLARNKNITSAYLSGYAIGSIYDIDKMTDDELAAHQLMRFPVDADGVPWTGDEKEFSLPSGEIKKFAAIAYGGGFWDVIDMDGRYSTALSCRHVPDADTPASLADELEAWCNCTDVDGDACGKPRNLAKRIRKLAKKEGER